MSKAFKAIWSDVRQSFVTTSEIQSSHGKRSKASVSLSVATVLLATSGLVSAAYVETGTLGDKASWETAEYNYNWGLGAMNASSAYALGFYGQNTTTGVMDSGAWLGKRASLGVSYYGAYGSKIKSNGVGATFKLAF